MAQKTLLVCDLHDDEQVEAETVSFGLDGTAYEIDLCEEHADALRDSLAPYVADGRRGAGRAPRARSSRPAPASSSPSSPSPSSSKADSSAVREWARANNVPVNERGRIPASVLAQYEAATS